jgi:cation transport ATPase
LNDLAFPSNLEDAGNVYFRGSGDAPMTHSKVKGPEAKTRLDANETGALPNHADDAEGHDQAPALSWRDINGVLFVAAAAGAIWFLGKTSNPYITAVGVTCTLVGAFPIFQEAYENIRQRRMTMELSIAIVIVAVLAIREIFPALVITLFVLVAEILKGLIVGRGRQKAH